MSTHESNSLNTNFENWDPMEGRIYKSDVGANEFVTASTVALLATNVSRFSNAAINSAKVIGLIQDWNISQTKQSPQLFECGSNGKYTLSTGRVAGSCSMSRVLFHGSNLLYLLYGGSYKIEGTDGMTQLQYEQKGIRDVAGFQNSEKTSGFAINLASSVFLNPLGLIFVLRTAQATTSGKKNVATFFLEDAYINSHGIGASAGAPYVGEQVSLTFEGVYPVDSNIGDSPWPPPA